MELKVIGAGLGRTGTASFKVALEQLGLGPCYHMGEVLNRPSDIEQWLAVVEGNPDWNTLLGKYASTSDYPACLYWRELAKLHPDARVVLTVRDAHTWFDSINATIMSPKLVEFVKSSPFGELNKRLIWDHYDGRTHDRAFMVQAFEKHIEDVKRSIPPERLLVYEVKQGWEPLCAFLQCPVPDSDFPRINTREQIIAMFETMMAGGPDGAQSTQGLSDAAAAIFGPA